MAMAMAMAMGQVPYNRMRKANAEKALRDQQRIVSVSGCARLQNPKEPRASGPGLLQSRSCSISSLLLLVCYFP